MATPPEIDPGRVPNELAGAVQEHGNPESPTTAVTIKVDPSGNLRIHLSLELIYHVNTSAGRKQAVEVIGQHVAYAIAQKNFTNELPNDAQGMLVARIDGFSRMEFVISSEPVDYKLGRLGQYAMIYQREILHEVCRFLHEKLKWSAESFLGERFRTPQTKAPVIQLCQKLVDNPDRKSGTLEIWARKEVPEEVEAT